MNSEEQLAKDSWSGHVHHPQILSTPPGDHHLLSIPSPLIHPKGDISHGDQNMFPDYEVSYSIAHGKKVQEKIRGNSGFVVNADSFLKADGRTISRSPKGFKSPTGDSGSQITL